MYQGYNNYYPQQSFNQFCGNPSGLKGRPVSSLEEARAANIDFDGSLFIFPDIANKRIYTKQICLDGTAALRMYNLVEDTTPTPTYVTKEEFDSKIRNLELLFNKQEEKDNGSKSSTTSNKQQLTF